MQELVRMKITNQMYLLQDFKVAQEINYRQLNEIICIEINHDEVTASTRRLLENYKWCRLTINKRLKLKLIDI